MPFGVRCFCPQESYFKDLNNDVWINLNKLAFYSGQKEMLMLTLL